MSRAEPRDQVKIFRERVDMDGFYRLFQGPRYCIELASHKPDPLKVMHLFGYNNDQRPSAFDYPLVWNRASQFYFYDMSSLFGKVQDCRDYNLLLDLVSAPNIIGSHLEHPEVATMAPMTNAANVELITFPPLPKPALMPEVPQKPLEVFHPKAIRPGSPKSLGPEGQGNKTYADMEEAESPIMIVKSSETRKPAPEPQQKHAAVVKASPIDGNARKISQKKKKAKKNRTGSKIPMCFLSAEARQMVLQKEKSKKKKEEAKRAQALKNARETQTQEKQEKVQAKELPYSKNICNRWRQKGYCTGGRRCEFIHPPEWKNRDNKNGN